MQRTVAEIQNDVDDRVAVMKSINDDIERSHAAHLRAFADYTRDCDRFQLAYSQWKKYNNELDIAQIKSRLPERGES